MRTYTGVHVCVSTQHTQAYRLAGRHGILVSGSHIIGVTQLNKQGCYICTRGRAMIHRYGSIMNPLFTQSWIRILISPTILKQSLK